MRQPVCEGAAAGPHNSMQISGCRRLAAGDQSAAAGAHVVLVDRVCRVQPQHEAALLRQVARLVQLYGFEWKQMGDSQQMGLSAQQVPEVAHTAQDESKIHQSSTAVRPRQHKVHTRAPRRRHRRCPAAAGLAAAQQRPSRCCGPASPWRPRCQASPAARGWRARWALCAASGAPQRRSR